MVGMKTTGEQISILCHNGTIFDKPREKKLDWPSKDTLESERIQNRPPTKLTIGLENRLSGVYMQNSTNTTVNQEHNS
jgi:hypothetical protein